MSRGNRLRRTWPQRLLLATNAMLAVACLGAAGGLWMLRSEVNSIPRANLGGALAPLPEPGDPRNILIIGTDSADGLDEDDPVTKGRDSGSRADVIMVLRIDPEAGTARLLSIPRDTWVPVAPNWRKGKINTAMDTADGPANLVRTIRRNFALSIDNYVALDFNGFRKLVDVLGGVPIYFAVPMRDSATGLLIEEPGCYTLDSGQALAYARSRKLQYQNPDTGRWVTDPAGDLARIERQQDFIKRSLRRASDKGVRDPGTATGIVDAASKAVILDDTLTVRSILDLMDRFRAFNPDELESFQVPTVAGPSSVISYQDVVWPEAEPILDLFRGGTGGGELRVGEVLVDVEATEATALEAGALSDGLERNGFDAERITVARGTTEPTLFHAPGSRRAAEQVARFIEGEVRVVEDRNLTGFRVVLAPGRGDAAVRLRERPLDLGDVRLPASLGATTSSTTSTVAVTTSEPEADPTDGPVDEGGEAGTPDGGPPVTQEQVSQVPTDPDAAAACR